MTTPPTVQSHRFRLGLVLTVCAVVAVALALVLLVIAPDHQGGTIGVPTNPLSQTTVEPRAASPTPAAAPPDTATPTAAPSGVVWSLVGQGAVPASDTSGPQRLSGCVASGYARSAVGVLIAAAQISTRSGYYAGRSCWEPTITGQFVPSTDQQMLLAALRDADAHNVAQAGPGELAQIAGFRFISYTSEVAVIGLIRRTAQGTHAQTTLTLTWLDEDWKLHAPAAGQWTASTSLLTGLTGTTPWGAR